MTLKGYWHYALWVQGEGISCVIGKGKEMRDDNKATLEDFNDPYRLHQACLQNRAKNSNLTIYFLVFRIIPSGYNVQSFPDPYKERAP